jgi:hypothetical protein
VASGFRPRWGLAANPVRVARAGRDRPRAVELVRAARNEAKATEPTSDALAAMERWLAGAR